MRHVALCGDDVSRNAVCLTKVRVASRDDSADKRAVVFIIEELDDLLGDGTLLVSTAVCRDDEDVFLINIQGLVTRTQRDSPSREPQLLHKSLRVIGC